jgi:hypothetical protein
MPEALGLPCSPGTGPFPDGGVVLRATVSIPRHVRHDGTGRASGPDRRLIGQRQTFGTGVMVRAITAPWTGPRWHSDRRGNRRGRSRGRREPTFLPPPVARRVRR